ncbi:MAG: outer membrane protein transport protein [Bacteroidota bacterium]|nr:outer membrane protein transport protein [Bacteroidota bacterium]
MQKRITSILALLFLAGSVLAGGPQVSLHGQKQIGMGLIGTSLSLDASSAFYNPGALAFLNQNTSVSFGISPLRSYAVYRTTQPSVYESRTNNPIGTPLYFYASTRINKKLTVAFALNTPYGNGLKWDKNWAGRFLIQDLALKCITLQPTLSYKVNSWLGIGAGFVYATGDVVLNKALPLDGTNGEGAIGIKGNAASTGYNVGVKVKPSSKLEFGIDYRSKLNMKLKNAPVDFNVPASLSASFPAGNTVNAALPLAANLDFGGSYWVNQKLMIGFSLNYVFWNAYDSLNFDFKTNTAQLPDVSSPREYKNTMIYRVGGQYLVNSKLTLRAGAYYDPSPCNPNYFTPETPSLNNTAVSCGLSYTPVKKVGVDLSFLYIQGQQKNLTFQPDNFSGTYKTRFFIPGIGVSFNL